MAINYNIKGTGLSISDEIRSYVEKRLAHLEKFVAGDPTAHVDVELEYQTSEDRQHYRAELTLSCGSALYRANALGNTLHEAVDIAEGELTREIGRSKKRSKDFVRRGAARFKDFIRGFRNRS